MSLTYSSNKLKQKLILKNCVSPSSKVSLILIKYYIYSIKRSNLVVPILPFDFKLDELISIQRTNKTNVFNEYIFIRGMLNNYLQFICKYFLFNLYRC